MNLEAKMTAAGFVMAIVGILITIEFLAVDAQLFGASPPQWIITLSNLIPLTGLDLDLLMTIDVILIVMEFKWQGERD